MNNYKTISKYCEAIGISHPKHPHFDIRSFEENMATVKSKMPPFRHEFYSIALKIEGEGIVISGHNTEFPENATIFFNSPFQILSWDIKPDWTGFYIMFSQDFISKSTYLKDILQYFPFLKIDKAVPFEVDKKAVKTIANIYASIKSNYLSNEKDKFVFIETYVLLLLNFVKRYLEKSIPHQETEDAIRKTDLKLLSRFQELIVNSFMAETTLETFSNVHSPTYYANILNIHPNHLNAVVKSITGITAKQHIQNHILQIAKSRLIHTQHSVKEIAYSLYFDSPNNFSNFFKKSTSKTPNSFRKEAIL